MLPGSFVVVQGIAGDGLANTIESTPVYEAGDDDDHEEGDDPMEISNDPGDGPLSSSSPFEEDHFQPAAMTMATLPSSSAVNNNNNNENAVNTATPSTTSLAAAFPGGAFSSSTGPGGLLLMSHLAKTNNTPGSLVAGGLTYAHRPAAVSTAVTAGVDSHHQSSSAPSSSSSSTDHSAQDAAHTPTPPPEESSFVVVPSEPSTPRRSRMYNTPSVTVTTPTRRQQQHDRQEPTKKQQAIQQWSQDVQERQLLQRAEWLLQERQRQQQQEQQHQQNHHQQQQYHTSRQTAATRSDRNDTIDQESVNHNRHDWWLDAKHNTGHLAVFDSLPITSPFQKPNHNNNKPALTGTQVGTLAPGTTLAAAQKLFTLDSETLEVLHVDDGNNNSSGDGVASGTVTNPTLMAPSIGCIQVLEFAWSPSISSSSQQVPASPASPEVLRNLSMIRSEDEDDNNSNAYDTKKKSPPPLRSSKDPPSTATKNATNVHRSIAYCVYSVHGYPFLIPGTPTTYMDPKIWWWRVTCKVGAFLRAGLELSSEYICTIPHGTLVQVTRKTVNRMGLSRLRVVVTQQPHIHDDNNSNQHDRSTVIQGWCSEFLNPLSGQRGQVIQPLPFSVPARYRVSLKEGAVIREQIELSSPQIGRAPYGAVLTIVARRFSEHPQDQCVERLKLAGGRDTGWISVRLNQVPPNDKCVVELLGVDERFDPKNPGEFHWKFLREQHIRRNREQARNNSGSPSYRDDDLSSLDEGSSPNGGGTTTRHPSTSANQQKETQTGRDQFIKQQAEKCLICLTEERNATIVHGETGHIACCLVCARILKARGDRVRRFKSLLCFVTLQFCLKNTHLCLYLLLLYSH